MDGQNLLNAAFSLSGVLFGWVVRAMWEAQKELRDDLKRIEQHLPEVYLRRDDFKDFSREIREMFAKILDKLDSKMDK